MSRRLALVALSLLTALLVLIAALSLRWRMVHDSPILLYIAYLLNARGYVPYRDLFDMNMPGTYAAYALIGWVCGYGDLGFRLADLAVLGVLLGTTWLWLRRLGRTVAWCATAVFGLKYLQASTGMSLQREYLLLVPLSLTLVTVETRWDGRIKALIVGLLFGLSAIIKPQALVSLPVVLWYLSGIQGRTQHGAPARKGETVLLALVGCALPVLGAALYLWASGALPAFVAMAMRYLPLYGALTEEHRTITGLARVVYLAKGFAAFGGHALWLMPALFGIYIAFYDSVLDDRHRRQVLLLVGLGIAYSLYPLFSGQFWDYHWLPFLYVLIALGALCLVARPPNTRAGAVSVPMLALLIAVMLAVRPPGEFWLQMRGDPIPAPNYGRDDQIADFLVANLRPGDRVQPLDWTRGGAAHAMLMARAEIATPFVYDFHFYHHVSTAYIQGLRRLFLSDLEAAHPRYVIEVTANNKPWVSGPDTTRSFPELRRLLDTEYTAVLQGDGYTILERAP